jgi:hypothetical protein
VLTIASSAHKERESGEEERVLEQLSISYQRRTLSVSFETERERETET